MCSVRVCVCVYVCVLTRAFVCVFVYLFVCLLFFSRGISRVMSDKSTTTGHAISVGPVLCRNENLAAREQYRRSAVG